MTSQQQTIQWKQLFSLAGLYGSVIIGWIAYYRYQPRLLQEFGLAHLSGLLVVAQAVILLLTPPIAGKIGDRYRVSRGHRIPIISAGMSFAAMIFMAVAFALVTTPGDVLRLLLPVMIILWLVGMSIFTSPALSTIELFAPVDKLPLAMAVLTMTGNLVNALEPVIVDVIDYLGAPATFSAGGVCVFLSGYALKRTSLGLFSAQGESTAEASPARSRYVFIFVLGAGLGVATTVLFNLFPSKLEAVIGPSLGGLGGNALTAWLLVLSAVISVPISSLVGQMGLRRSYAAGFVLAVASLTGVLTGSGFSFTFAFLLLFIASFTVLYVVALPLALSESTIREKVFCVGIFYSGTALPEGLMDVYQWMQH